MLCKGFVLFWGKVEAVDEVDEVDGGGVREVCKDDTRRVNAMGYFWW